MGTFWVQLESQKSVKDATSLTSVKCLFKFFGFSKACFLKSKKDYLSSAVWWGAGACHKAWNVSGGSPVRFPHVDTFY